MAKPDERNDAMPASGCEIWFYHLERSTLDQVLPGLLEKTRERGWRALVRAPDAGRLGEISDQLWTFRPEAFLAHGRTDEPHGDRQPILLTDQMENPNGAQALFIVDGAELGDLSGLERCFVIFDGRDEAALQGARALWKRLRDADQAMAYWKQTETGRWEKAA